QRASWVRAGLHCRRLRFVGNGEVAVCGASHRAILGMAARSARSEKGIPIFCATKERKRWVSPFRFPGSSLTSRGAMAVFLHLHAHLGQQIVQGALLKTPVHEVVEPHQGATLSPGILHILKDGPL